MKREIYEYRESIQRRRNIGDKDVMTRPKRRPECVNSSRNGRVIGTNGSIALFLQIKFVTV